MACFLTIVYLHAVFKPDGYMAVSHFLLCLEQAIRKLSSGYPWRTLIMITLLAPKGKETPQ